MVAAAQWERVERVQSLLQAARHEYCLAALEVATGQVQVGHDHGAGEEGFWTL